jgi:hypothetical protein
MGRRKGAVSEVYEELKERAKKISAQNQSPRNKNSDTK